MNPNHDQYLAAVAHARRIVERHRAAGWAAYLPDMQPAPGAVIAWMRDHAASFRDETLARCGHITSLSAPAFVIGREPNVLLCGACLQVKTDELAAGFASAVDGADCDLCGVRASELNMCAFNSGAVVFRGFACDPCLAPNPFVRTA
ncbi:MULTISPECIES: hypothetical protein [unclassified Pseudonocardia]|uniref:hypothetical protein n=1 Tax=unclassified Pseudonocardia TaxID=2619320 RepID=UPI0001FFEC3D|nr:hypothetical protein [Pseudonocardia sp. Ae707_Ps1]OLM21302.1 hypothetical protein Ae707Ps1_5561 [Pseudonocardia sp. Ae707_Ps1]